jgi:AraC family transcriptional regulator
MTTVRPQATSLADRARSVSLACQASAARVVDVGYPPATDYDTHPHDEAYLCLVARGTYDEWRSVGKRHAVTASQLLVYEQGSAHAVRTGPKQVRILHVTDPSGGDWADGPLPSAAGVLWQLQVLVEAAARGWDDADQLRLESLVLELAPAEAPASGVGSRRAHGGGKSERWLESVRTRLRDAYRTPFSLDALARDAGRHPAHLARAFKNRWGMSTGEYLRRVRVAAAVRMLRDTPEPLSLVALDSGFSDQSHMGRWVRRYTGTTPLAIRNAANADSS